MLSIQIDLSIEYELCRQSPSYFVDSYCHIYDNLAKDWIPFRLWQFQKEALDNLHQDQYSIWLKTRQIGCTWLGDGYGLWGKLFNPIFPGLYFSLRETEAQELISTNRLRGMYQRLPSWMIKACHAQTSLDNAGYWQLANGSSARAFAGGTGDSYTAAYAMIDEADLIDDLQDTLNRVKPTVEAGGKLLLLSRINKKRHSSAFRDIWKEARLGNNLYKPTFFPWNIHPLRDELWYEREKRNTINQDDLWANYPATELEALAMGYQGMVFPNFSPELNVSPDADYDPDYPVEWWVDIGYTNPTSIVFAQWRHFQGMPDRVCIFDVIYLTHMLPTTILEMALKKPYPPPERFVYDSASPAFAAEFKRMRLEKGLMTSVIASSKNVAENIKNMRNYIGDDYNPRLLQIHPRCAIVIDEIMKYHYKESGAMKGGDYLPVDEYNHTISSCTYGLAQRMYRIG